jgi:hypothetical protein
LIKIFQTQSKWQVNRGKKKAAYPIDHIESYLSEGVMTPEAIAEAGGYLPYWNNALKMRSSVARMAIDYVSAPGFCYVFCIMHLLIIHSLATSVEAERAFSVGRRQVNFMQHNMSSQTFKARMAVGSWAKTPLFPGIDKVSEYIDLRGNEKDLDRAEE